MTGLVAAEANKPTLKRRGMARVVLEAAEAQDPSYKPPKPDLARALACYAIEHPELAGVERRDLTLAEHLVRLSYAGRQTARHPTPVAPIVLTTSHGHRQKHIQPGSTIVDHGTTAPTVIERSLPGMRFGEQRERVTGATIGQRAPEDPATPRQGAARERVEPVYRPSGDDGEIVVYAGELAVRGAVGEQRVTGQLALRLAATPAFTAHFAAAHIDLLFPAVDEEHVVDVPSGAILAPPVRSTLTQGATEPEPVGPMTMNELHAGDLGSAERFIFHVSGALEACLPIVQVNGGHQPQLAFSFTGWDLVVAPIDEPKGEHDFAFVVQATRPTPPTVADVDELHRRLFILLSFITSREVGVGPICGLSSSGAVCWASWGAPRQRLGRPGVRWCTRILVANALPAIAAGFTQVASDPAMEAVVERAINQLLAADGTEALDVRVPVACAGLEMLGWAVLQRHGWVEAETLQRMSAAALTRLLLSGPTSRSPSRTAFRHSPVDKTPARQSVVRKSSGQFATGSSTHPRGLTILSGPARRTSARRGSLPPGTSSSRCYACSATTATTGAGCDWADTARTSSGCRGPACRIPGHPTGR